MSFRITYRNLFEVQILHHYFLDRGEKLWDLADPESKARSLENYDVRDFLEIYPAPECQHILNSNNCLYKLTSKGILVGIRSLPDESHPELFRPFKSLDENLKFRFILKLKDGYFTDYTSLPLNDNAGKIFLFRNSGTDNFRRYPSLSAIPPVFSSGKEYMPGDMLSDDGLVQSGLFTAIVKTKNNTSVADDWLKEEITTGCPLSFANISDRETYFSGVFTYQMKEKDVYPEIIIKNQADEEVKPLIRIVRADYYAIQAAMYNFPPGFYSASITGKNSTYNDKADFYLAQEKETPFGIIEIAIKSNFPEYNLIDLGTLRSPVFELRFRNRRTYWRYFRKDATIIHEVNKPLPLTRYGTINVTRPPLTGESGSVMLPNPVNPVINAAAFTAEDDKKFYSDIHIN